MLECHVAAYLGDGHDRERLNPRARIVGARLHQPRVDHETDTGERQGRLRDVGRQNDLETAKSKVLSNVCKYVSIK